MADTEVEIRGWDRSSQSFALTKNGVTTVYTLGRSDTQFLAEIFGYRQAIMEDDSDG